MPYINSKQSSPIGQFELLPCTGIICAVIPGFSIGAGADVTVDEGVRAETEAL